MADEEGISEVSLGSPETITADRQPLDSAALHKARTARLLAVLSFVAVCALFLAQFVSVWILARNRPDAIEEITRVFNVWIPVFAGFFGSAATFYFTQERR
jgi:hypothetical protein